MSRFLITLAAVVVAGAMYVAAAPGSQQAGPTAGQFKALKKEVAKLQKQVKNANDNVSALAFVMGHCMLSATLGVAQKGDPSNAPTYGYAFTPNGGPQGVTTALDLSNTPTTTLLTLNSDPQCAALIGPNARHPGALARWARLHH